MGDSVRSFVFCNKTKKWYEVQKDKDNGHYHMMLINTPPTQEEPSDEGRPTVFILYDEMNGWSEFLTAEELETVPVFLNGERITTNL